MGLALLALLAIPAILFAGGLYLWHLGKSFTVVPPDALKLSPHRWTIEEIENEASKLSITPFDIRPHLPPATGRMYIVVGGSGLVGGWIVLHLLARGEPPENIRIVDIRRPVRKDLITGPAAKVGFVSADVKDPQSIRNALKAEWPTVITSALPEVPGITVFHTVAGIRYYERHRTLIPRSSVLNVEGTRNVIAAAKEAGVDTLIFTSSASIAITRTKFLVSPWQTHAKTLVQVVDDTTLASSQERKHSEFFSNYAYTKYLAEQLILEANDPMNRFWTGALRPGNAIFGPGGDLNLGAYIVRGTNPSWVGPMIQSFTYVENVSYSHLAYEHRLISERNAIADGPVPSVSGQTYIIADDGDPPTYNDAYLALKTLTSGKTQFPSVPPAPLFILAHIIEFYYVLQARFPRILPAITGDLANLQPSIFELVNIHLKLDDSRARSSPSKGGFAYSPPLTTLQGVCLLVKDHLEQNEQGDDHQRTGGGIGLGFKAKSRSRRNS